MGENTKITASGVVHIDSAHWVHVKPELETLPEAVAGLIKLVESLLIAVAKLTAEVEKRR